jgi:hypothetical protein
MERARECCPQIRRLLPLEYTEQLLLSQSGWFTWSPKKAVLLTEVEKDKVSERMLLSSKVYAAA